MKDLINTSDTSVSINDYPLQVVEYKGERVVSSYDIANLHNKPVKAVNQQFERNKERLKEGIDYFLINKEEFSESQSVTQTFIPNNVKDIKLFTERGYLKLVKSFTDDLSWQVQDLLVDSYFKLKEALSSKNSLLLDIVTADDAKERALALSNYELGYVKPLEQFKEQALPKVDFFDTVTASEKLIDIGESSKVLLFKGLGRNNLFKVLRGLEILDKNNVPYQKYVSRGYFKLIETTINGKPYIKTGVYQKGLDFLNKTLVNAGYERLPR